MNEESTTKPGVRCSKNEETHLVDAFLRKFRAQDLTYKQKVPSWTNFPKGTPVEVNFLLKEPTKLFETLLVFFEFQREIWKASPDEIWRYLVNREPWEDFDLYIFPNTMDWCCVFTHELMNGIQSFVIPELSTPTEPK
jgi:hypothetical protein